LQIGEKREASPGGGQSCRGEPAAGPRPQEPHAKRIPAMRVRASFYPGNPGMIVRNAFTVPLPPDEAWQLLLDIRRISECVPGGALSEIVDERSFKGRMRVRLGPVLVEFVGTARFENLDDRAHSATLRAAGNDTKGRGSASARTEFTLAPDPAGSTVLIETDLQLAGMIAQYGRASGVIAALSQQLVDEFAANLSVEIAARETAGAEPGAPKSPGEKPRTAPSELSGFGFLWRAFRAWLKRTLTRGAPGVGR
jgi:carbon monoxide dehydrogenase subunit G